ncbi:ATP-binding protein [Metaclostridioides mangenotii]|uniref:ATP-binding protein n=1 Tax=Metaclostridioides mangenotii TaxID=1540 RepID=UPI002149D0D6|nr:ATP-binding protein [Clostridioides mangenotii]
MSDLKTGLAEAVNINGIKFNEVRDVTILILISVTVMFLINDIVRFEIMIHCLYATFLIAMGMIILNTSRYKMETLQTFLGIVAIIIGGVECIFLIKFLNFRVLPEMMFDINIITLAITDLSPAVAIYLGIRHVKNKKTVTRSVVEFVIFLVIIVSVVLFFKFIDSNRNGTIPYYEVRVFISLTMLFFSILVLRKIKSNSISILGEEKICYKRIVQLLLISTVPSLLYPIINNLYVIDVISQITINLTMYYIYRYMTYITVKKTYDQLNYTNDQLKEKNEILQEKNKMLILENQKIADLKKELQQKEIKLQTTLDLSCNGIIVLNLHKQISFANSIFEEIFISGKPKDSLHEYIINYNDLMESFNYVCKEKLDAIKHIETVDKMTFEVKLSPLIVGSNIQGVLCVFKDKTKKLEAEEKIYQANERYERFLESVGDGIVVVHDDKIIYTNRACKKMFKEKIDEIDFLACCKRGQLERMYRVGKNIIYVEFDYAKYAKDDKDTYIIVVRDVTDRKISKIKLEDSQDSYADFIDVLPDGICLVNRNMKIAYVNKSMLNILDMETSSEIVGKNLKEFVDNSLKYEDIEKLVKNVNNDSSSENLISHEFISLSGERKNVELSILPFTMKKSNLIMIIVKDLIHKRNYELAEAELLERFKADKIKTEFFANMSHELKTPLNVISSSNQLVDSFYRSGKVIDYHNNIRGHVELVRQSSYRLQRLINNIIDLTKMESGFYRLKLASYNIVEVVEDLFMKIEPYSSRKGLSIVFDTEEEEINTYIDKLEFERIMLNLLSNCIKFTDYGGTISINIYVVESEDVVVSVKDTGVGIPNDKLEIIFEEFSQVDKTLSRNTEGSGIGLSIAKNLIELHGGDIKVLSNENEGTEFRLKVPIKPVIYDIVNEDKRIYNLEERIKIEFSDIYY